MKYTPPRLRCRFIHEFRRFCLIFRVFVQLKDESEEIIVGELRNIRIDLVSDEIISNWKL